MTGTERKRRWRLANPERSREHERQRALLRRRHGTWVEGPDGKPMTFSYPSGISYERYESWGTEPWRYSEQEWNQRRCRGIGRPASRWRQYLKRLRERIEARKALLAAINEELGLPADASFEDWGRALLTYRGDKLDELLGITEKISKLKESAA
jgi:hypothetical protein